MDNRAAVKVRGDPARCLERRDCGQGEKSETGRENNENGDALTKSGTKTKTNRESATSYQATPAA